MTFWSPPSFRARHCTCTMHIVRCACFEPGISHAYRDLCTVRFFIYSICKMLIIYRNALNKNLLTRNNFFKSVDSFYLRSLSVPIKSCV